MNTAVSIGRRNTCGVSCPRFQQRNPIA